MNTTQINKFVAALPEAENPKSVKAYGIDADGNSVKFSPAADVVIADNEKVLTLDEGKLKTEMSLSYDSETNIIRLLGQDGSAISSIDASQFVTSGLIDSVSLETVDGVQYLLIVFKTEEGTQEIRLETQSLITAYSGKNLLLSADYFIPAAYSAPAAGTSMDTAIGNIIRKAKDNEQRISALENQSKSSSSGKLYAHIIEVYHPGPNMHGMFIWVNDSATSFASMNVQQRNKATKGATIPVTHIVTVYSDYIFVRCSFDVDGMTYYYKANSAARVLTSIRMVGNYPITDVVLEIGSTAASLQGMPQWAELPEDAKVGTIGQYIGESVNNLVHGFFYEKTEDGFVAVKVSEGSDITLDDSVTETSSNGVKSSGIYSFIQPTAQQVKQNKTDIANNAKTIGLLSKETEANAADIEELKKRKTAEWGNIGGDISSQTDLQAALNAKQDSIAGSGAGSTALGVGTIASAPYQIALGRYNVEDTEGRFALIVGNGTSDENRSNAFAVTWSGEIVSDDMSSLVRNLGGVTGISAVSDVPEQQENGVLYVITA